MKEMIMGFLSSIFKYKKKPQLSYVRNWALQKEQEAKDDLSKIDIEFYFGVLIYIASSFGDFWQDMMEPDDVPEDKVQYAKAPYSGDASIFEIACYTFTKVDLWLFQNAPDRRELMSSYLNQRIVELFNKALSFNSYEELKAIYEERIVKYSAMVRESGDIEQIHKYLVELLKRTKYNTSPKIANFNDFQFSTDGDIFDHMQLTTLVVSHESHMIPTIIQSTQSFIQSL